MIADKNNKASFRATNIRNSCVGGGESSSEHVLSTLQQGGSKVDDRWEQV